MSELKVACQERDRPASRQRGRERERERGRLASEERGREGDLGGALGATCESRTPTKSTYFSLSRLVHSRVLETEDLKTVTGVPFS